VATMSLGSPSIFGVRPKIKAEIRTEKSVTKDTAKMLEFAVLHGDIVVMHGAEIHRQYLVSIHPETRLVNLCHRVLTAINSTKLTHVASGDMPRRAEPSSRDLSMMRVSEPLLWSTASSHLTPPTSNTTAMSTSLWVRLLKTRTVSLQLPIHGPLQHSSVSQQAFVDTGLFRKTLHDRHHHQICWWILLLRLSLRLFSLGL